MNIKMNKPAYLYLGCTLSAGIVAGCQSGQKKDESNTDKLPNLIVIMTDDMGYADVGFNGCLDIPTPAIDRIAHEGVRFTQGYVTAAICGPSRAGFMTGRYQDRFGFTTNPSVDPNNSMAGLPLEEETMAEVLRKAGYKNAIIGKWHLGTHPVFHPLERGFDYFYGFLSGGARYFPEELTLNDLSEVTQKWEWYHLKIIENRKTVDVNDYLTDEFSHAAVKFINEQIENDQPHDFLYWRKWEQNAMAIRNGNYKLVSNSQMDQHTPELFNLTADISETVNIQSNQKELSEKLLQEWQKWNSQLKDRLFSTLADDVWWE